MSRINMARKHTLPPIQTSEQLGGFRNAPALEIADDLARRIVTGKPRDAATGMGGRSTHVKPLQRPAIIAVAEHRTRAVKLIEAQLPMENIAADERELPLHIQRRQDHSSEYGRTEVRRIG